MTLSQTPETFASNLTRGLVLDKLADKGGVGRQWAKDLRTPTGGVRGSP
ncbi:unnamed protein product, partial [marine sediment metagenome]